MDAEVLHDGRVVIVGSANDHPVFPAAGARQATGWLKNGSLEVVLREPQLTPEMVAGHEHFGERAWRVTPTGPAGPFITMGCVWGTTMFGERAAYPCWIEWLNEPLAAPLMRVYHAGPEAFSPFSTSKKMLLWQSFRTNQAMRIETKGADKGALRLLVAYTDIGHTMVDFWDRPDDIDWQGPDHAGLAKLSPKKGLEILATLPNNLKILPLALGERAGGLVYIGNGSSPVVVHVDAQTAEPLGVSAVDGADTISFAVWHEERFYATGRVAGDTNGKALAIRTDGSIAWSTTLPGTKHYSGWVHHEAGLGVSDRGMLIPMRTFHPLKDYSELHDYGFHTTIHCLDLHGKLRWSVPIGREVHRFTGFFARWLPGGRVLTGGTAFRPGYGRRYQGFLAVFDAKGKLIPWTQAWKTP